MSTRSLPILLLVAATAACSVLERARDVEQSGFLSDYSMLQEGADDEAIMVYRKPGLDLRGYAAIIVEPVQVWRTPSATNDLPPEEYARLAGVLHTMVVDELDSQWRIVNAPGPGVLRLRMALTDAEPSSVAMDITSMIVPIGMIVSAVDNMATGVNTFVGQASGEAEITDSVTGEVLMAGVDRRVGGKSWTGASDEKSDIMAAFEHWASRIKLRLTRG